MAASILNSTKKVLGVASDYTEFDIDIIMFINTALANLNQIGIGPVDGFAIEDSEPTWDDFLMGDPRVNSAQTFVALTVRLLFDTPKTSFEIGSIEKVLEQLTWRLNVTYESTSYGTVAGASGVIDGGGP